MCNANEFAQGKPAIQTYVPNKEGVLSLISPNRATIEWTYRSISIGHEIQALLVNSLSM